MNVADVDGAEREGGDDIVAAEYVLGTLSADDRREAARRIDSEPAFARNVDRWEVRLAPIATGYTEVEAPATVKAAVDRRLFGAAAGDPSAGFWSNLIFWRGLAGFAVAAALLLAALPVFYPTPTAPPAERMIASIADPATGVSYLAVYDAATGEIGMSRVAGEAGAGQDFELWVVAGNDPPASLGVIPTGEGARMTVDESMRERMHSGSVIAISLEKAGGSTTGAPATVVAAGDLRTI